MFAQKIGCVYVNYLPYFKGITYLPLLFHFVLLLFNVPLNNFTVCRDGATASYVLSESVQCNAMKEWKLSISILWIKL